MGKVEILTLIAGVVLSIALALIVVPIFKSSGDMSKKTQIKHEVISLIKHKDLWEMDKTLDKDLKFDKSYENHTKDVNIVGEYIEFTSGNKCKVGEDPDDSTYFTINCIVDPENKLDSSYDDLIKDLTKNAYEKKFINGSDPTAPDKDITITDPTPTP